MQNLELSAAAATCWKLAPFTFLMKLAKPLDFISCMLQRIGLHGDVAVFRSNWISDSCKNMSYFSCYAMAFLIFSRHSGSIILPKITSFMVHKDLGCFFRHYTPLRWIKPPLWHCYRHCIFCFLDPGPVPPPVFQCCIRHTATVALMGLRVPGFIGLISQHKCCWMRNPSRKVCSLFAKLTAIAGHFWAQPPLHYIEHSQIVFAVQLKCKGE